MSVVNYSHISLKHFLFSFFIKKKKNKRHISRRKAEPRSVGSRFFCVQRNYSEEGNRQGCLLDKRELEGLAEVGDSGKQGGTSEEMRLNPGSKEKVARTVA